MLNRNDDVNFKTEYIREEISRCEDVEELKKRILPLLKSQQEEWRQKVAEIISCNGYTKSKFAELCGVKDPFQKVEKHFCELEWLQNMI